MLTWVLRLLPVLGFGLLLVGWNEWYPEDWLDSKGFVINLASGLTTACFGVPIAVFGIQWLVQQRAGEDELETLRYLMSKNVAAVARSSFDMLANVMPDTVNDAVGALIKVQRALQFTLAYERGESLPSAYELMPNPKAHVTRLLRIVSDYYLACIGETLFFTTSQRQLAVMKWEVVSSELLPRLEFLRSESGIADADIEEMETFLRGSKVLDVLSDYLSPDHETWADLVFPTTTNREDGYSINLEALGHLIDLTHGAYEELANYAAYTRALERAANAVGASLKGIDKKVFDPKSVDTSPFRV